MLLIYIFALLFHAITYNIYETFEFSRLCDFDFRLLIQYIIGDCRIYIILLCFITHDITAIVLIDVDAYADVCYRRFIDASRDIRQAFRRA